MKAFDTEEDVASLLKKYDIAYPRGGFYVGKGWLSLIEELINLLIASGWDKDLHQVKEKFGSLRFYIGKSTPQMIDIISSFESRTQTLCEACGKLGKRTNKGWLKILCDEHLEEWKKES